MKLFAKKSRLLGLVLSAGLAVGAANAYGAGIGFNFQGGNGSALGGDATTGAGGTATSDWNEMLPAGPNGGPSVIGGLTVEWTSNGTWQTGSTNNNNLTNGYQDTSDAAAAILSVSGLNSVLTNEGSRDIYVYFGADGAGRFGNVILNPVFDAGNQTGDNLLSSDGAFEFLSIAGDAGFSRTTDTDLGPGPAPSANYAVFNIPDNVDSFSVAVARPAANQPSTGLHGIEIVEVPEPSCLVLLGLGGIGLLVARRF